MSEIMPDPRKDTAYRAAKLAVIILSGLIILALIALVVGAARQMSRKSAAAGAAASAVAEAPVYRLPAGAVIVAMETQPGRVILRLRLQGTDEIDILDMDSGRLVSRIRSAP